MSWERWRLTLGGRYDQVSVSNIDKLNQTRSDLDKNNFSSRAALLYLFDNGFARTSATPPPLRRPASPMKTATCWIR
jgi:outer membrane receptor protein involved in Fe transport